MQAHTQVITSLNELLTLQLTAINQLFLHARMQNHWGFKKVGEVVYKRSIKVMKNAQKVTDRILYLEGLPNYQKLLKLNVGENVHEQLKSDMTLSLDERTKTQAAIQVALQHHDHVTRDLLEEIGDDVEEYIDWLEAQENIIKDIGVEKYLAEMF